jgi:serine protease
VIALLLGVAWAGPVRAPQRPAALVWEEGRRRDQLVVKLREGAGVVPEQTASGLRLGGPGDGQGLGPLLAGARPRFPRDPVAIAQDRATFDPEQALADLRLYLVLEGEGLEERGRALLADPRVETVYHAFAPMPPPQDIPPETPDFSELQGYLGPAPDGLGFDEAARWPGGTGEWVAVADLEYGWQPEHEDLGATLDAAAWGWDSGYYDYHGNAVLGQLFAGDDGYGVTGMVPDAEALVVSPYDADRRYDIAAAIDGAASLLDAGDVLLIEQQSWANGNYAPVEVDPAVFDAIALAVAKGIVVVEPTGNGGQDLDAAAWGGWFDRSLRDSGAILVGGGWSPEGGGQARTWSGGSCYGGRVDLQGWYDSIVTATTRGYSPDLFYPGGDELQAYTSAFGGTSGASPMVAGAAAVVQSVAWELWGQPWDPLDLRAALVGTGTPQPADDLDHPIGPLPDLRRMLRTWSVR